MERKQLFASIAGIGAVLILGGVALAAASQSLGDAAAPRGPLPVAPPGLIMPLVMPQALLGRLADELGLTAEQRQAIRELLDQARPGLTQLHRQMQAGAELLARTAPDDPAYQSVVANVSQSTADLAAQYVLQSSQLRSQVHGVLTPAQRTRLAALEADRLAEVMERPLGGPPTDGDGGPKGPQ
jgi:Spy/CpxP family protein refolding chaperone